MKAAAFALGAAVALALSPASAQSKLAIKRPLKPRVTPQAPTVSVDSSTFELNSSSWPVVKLPSFTPGTPPSPLPPPHPDLRAVEPGSPPAKTSPWQQPAPAASRPRTSITYRIESTTPGLFVAGWSPQTETHSPSFTFSCVEKSSATPRAFYWERLQREADGSAKIIFGEGWIDTSTCKVAGGSRVEIPLATAATLENGPLAFGARTEQGIWLVFPQPTQFSLSSLDTNPKKPQPPQPRGVISHALLPVRKGDAVVASISLFSHNINTWRTAFALPATEASNVSHIPLSLRIDVSQAIREESPLALVTLQRPVSVETAPQPVLPSRLDFVRLRESQSFSGHFRSSAGNNDGVVGLIGGVDGAVVGGLGSGIGVSRGASGIGLGNVGTIGRGGLGSKGSKPTPPPPKK